VSRRTGWPHGGATPVTTTGSSHRGGLLDVVIIVIGVVIQVVIRVVPVVLIGVVFVVLVIV
jgi:hypothetical protein